MRKIFGILLIILAFSTFAMAFSETGVSFAINDHKDTTTDYIAPAGFWNNYGNYVVVILIILAFCYVIVFGMRNNKNHRREKKRILKKKVKRK